MITILSGPARPMASVIFGGTVPFPPLAAVPLAIFVPVSVSIPVSAGLVLPMTPLVGRLPWCRNTVGLLRLVGVLT